MTAQTLDLVGPKGYIHGWVYVGTSGAAQLHGKPVTGTTASGGKIQGIYDHINHEVVSPFGKRQKVTHVEQQLGQDWRQALASYDRRVAKGTLKFGPSGYAQGNAGQKAADRDLMNFVRQHVHQMSNPTSAAGRKAAYRAGNALPPPSSGAAPGFPITSGAQWEKARNAVGRAGSPQRRALLAKLLRKTAPKYGKTKALAQSWAAPGGTRNMAYDTMAEIGGLAARRVLNLAASMTKCPSCGYEADSSSFSVSGGSSGTSSPSQPGELRTPANPGLQDATGFNQGQIGMSNALDFTGPAVTDVTDLMIARENGKAVVRHRRGGATIGTIGRDPSGQWKASIGDKALNPHNHQRAALTELIGTWNANALTPQHRPGSVIQPPAEQTPLMQQFGVPAVRAFATPAAGTSDGPRATSSGDGSDLAGLSARGVTIYRKLRARNFPPDRALAFARRAQNFGSGGQ